MKPSQRGEFSPSFLPDRREMTGASVPCAAAAEHFGVTQALRHVLCGATSYFGAAGSSVREWMPSLR
jgi:hypothetical protein